MLGICVDAEVGALAFDHASDVGFTDVGVDLHFSQVLGDDEESRRLKRGGDGLADIHVAGHHDAVYGRIDGGIAQIQLGRSQCGFRLVQLGLRHLDVGLGITVIGLSKVEIGLRHEGLGTQYGHAIAFSLPLSRHVLGLGQVPFGAFHGGAGLAHSRLKRILVDLRQNLSLCHDGIEIRKELDDFTRHLAAHLN